MPCEVIKRNMGCSQYGTFPLFGEKKYHSEFVFGGKAIYLLVVLKKMYCIYRHLYRISERNVCFLESEMMDLI